MNECDGFGINGRWFICVYVFLVELISPTSMRLIGITRWLKMQLAKNSNFHCKYFTFYLNKNIVFFPSNSFAQKNTTGFRKHSNDLCIEKKKSAHLIWENGQCRSFNIYEKCNRYFCCWFIDLLQFDPVSCHTHAQTVANLMERTIVVSQFHCFSLRFPCLSFESKKKKKFTKRNYASDEMRHK